LTSLQNIKEFSFSPPQKKFNLIQALFLDFLLLGGLVFWGFFLNWGKGPVNFEDWADITAPRLAFVQNALVNFQLPLESTSAFHAGKLFTNLFLTIPDIILGPEIFLLWFLNISQFSLIHVWIMYILGFFGLLQIRKIKSLSIASITIIFLLFNFNGFIASHIEIGHLSFASFFLVIWFVYLFLELLEGKQNWWWIFRMVLFFFVLELEGGFHIFIWCLIFLIFFVIFYPRYFKILLETGLLILAANLFRFLPALSLLGNYSSELLTGFPNIQSILGALWDTTSPGTYTSFNGLLSPGQIGQWEVTMFIGVLGVVYVIYFGVARLLRDQELPSTIQRLLLPLLVLSIFSLDSIYRLLVNALPIPLLTAERVPTRIYSLILVFLIVLAGIEFQRWVEKKDRSNLVLLAIALLILVGLNDLWVNFEHWALPISASAYPTAGFNSSIWKVLNTFQNMTYIYLLWAGLAGTLATLIFLIIKTIREKRSSGQVFIG
jgi:hypothetical protein